MNIEEKFRFKVLLKAKSKEEIANLLENLYCILEIIKEITDERIEKEVRE